MRKMCKRTLGFYLTLLILIMDYGAKVLKVFREAAHANPGLELLTL